MTLADRFRHAGYATGLVGKWHNGTFDRRFEPNARGFDEFLGFCGGWVDYFDYTLRVNDGTRRSDGSYMTDVLTEEALGFVERHKSAPFFLHLAYSAPHSPFQAPDGMADPHLEKGLNRIVATTYAMIERMDEGIGRLLDKLDADGLTEQTIVLFTSDNGPAFFNPPYMLEPGEDTFNERFNAGLRGSKGWIYEGGIRVPMILRYPERLPAGTTNDDLIQFVDWVPTLMRMAGLPEIDAPPLDGSDVSAALMGEPANLPDQQFWQWNFYMPCIGTNAAMREGRWKLVRPMMKGTRFFSPELYATPRGRRALQGLRRGRHCPQEGPALDPGTGAGAAAPSARARAARALRPRRRPGRAARPGRPAPRPGHGHAGQARRLVRPGRGRPPHDSPTCRSEASVGGGRRRQGQHGEQAAIDLEIGAGDPGGARRGEEGDRLGDVLRLARAAAPAACPPARPAPSSPSRSLNIVSPGLAQQRRVDRPGADRVGADAVPPVIERDAARHAEQCCLARHIGQPLAERGKRVDRGDGDDRAAATASSSPGWRAWRPASRHRG